MGWSGFIRALGVAIALALGALSASAQKAPSDIVRITEVSRFEKPHPDRPVMIQSAEYTVVLREAVPLARVHELADEARTRVRDAYWLALRFVFDDWPRPGMDRAVGTPHYAWVLFRDGRRETSNSFGVSDEDLERQLAQFTPSPGEKIEGVWVDRYSMLGVVMLTRQGKKVYFARASMPDRRWLMKPWKRQAPGRHLVSDGEDGDPIAITITPENMLHEFVSTYVKALPWQIAHPVTSAATSR